MIQKFGVAFIFVTCLALTACVVYEPVPAYYPAQKPAQTFELAWASALDAVKESGVRVTTADSSRGVIRGTRDQTEVLVTVAQQADGTLQVEVEAKSPQGRDSGLAKRISEAYQVRMRR